MKIDIHSHLLRVDGKYQVEELLADIAKNNLDFRVISTLQGPSIRCSNQYISDLVKNRKQLLGCAIINPKLDSAMEDTIHAVSLDNIKMIEFNSFEHGYYPDDCEKLDEILTIIGQANLPVKVFTGLGAHALPHQWEQHVVNHREIEFVFLHMGCFDYGYGCIDLAARHDNIYLETSNQYEMQILRKAFKELPREKLLFGTMYPERLTSNGIDIFDMFDLDRDTINAIMHRNAEKLLKI